MKIKLAGILLLSVCLLTACYTNPYREKDFIGKTSKEIMTEFGEFDCITMAADADGVYRNACCGYTIKESSVGFFGKTEEIIFFIHFNENGTAVECSEGYRPGG